MCRCLAGTSGTFQLEECGKGGVGGEGRYGRVWEVRARCERGG